MKYWDWALKQQGFSSLEQAHKKKRTKREIFLGEMGRPDVVSVAGLLGIKDAAPLLIEAFSRLRERPAPPPNVFLAAGKSLPLPLRHFQARSDPNFIDLTNQKSPFYLSAPR